MQLNSIHYNQVTITVLIPTQHQLMISQRIQSSLPFYLVVDLLVGGKLTNGLFLLVILQEIMTMYVVQLVTPSDKYIVPWLTIQKKIIRFYFFLQSTLITIWCSLNKRDRIIGFTFSMVIPKWVILSSEFYPTMTEVPTAKKKRKIHIQILSPNQTSRFFITKFKVNVKL